MRILINIVYVKDPMSRAEIVRKAKALYRDNEGLSVALLQRIFKINQETARLILRLVHHDLVTSQSDHS